MNIKYPDLIALFNLDPISEEGNLLYNDSNYLSFNKEDAWRSKPGVSWLYKGNGLFHFRLDRGQAYYRPTESLSDTNPESIILYRKIDKIEMYLECIVISFELPRIGTLENETKTRSCGIASLYVIDYEVVIH